MKKFLTLAAIFTLIVTPLSVNANGWVFGKAEQNVNKESAEDQKAAIITQKMLDAASDIAASTKSGTIPTVAQLNRQANTTDILVHNTIVNIALAITSAQEAEEIKNSINSILNNPKTTEIEKSKELDKLINAFNISLIDNENYVSTKFKNMTPQQKIIFTNNLSILSISGSNYKGIANTYPKVIKASRKNGEYSTTIKPMRKTIKNHTKALKRKAKTVKKLVKDVKATAKDNNIKIQSSKK